MCSCKFFICVFVITSQCCQQFHWLLSVFGSECSPWSYTPRAGSHEALMQGFQQSLQWRRRAIESCRGHLCRGQSTPEQLPMRPMPVKDPQDTFLKSAEMLLTSRVTQWRNGDLQVQKLGDFLNTAAYKNILKTWKYINVILFFPNCCSLNQVDFLKGHFTQK